MSATSDRYAALAEEALAAAKLVDNRSEKTDHLDRAARFATLSERVRGETSMRPTYSRMLAEHAEIVEAADQLLTGLEEADRVPASQHYTRLCVLAAMVEQHLAGEDQVVADMAMVDLTGPWTIAWEGAAAKFQRLKADWLAFLDHWTLAMLEEHRHEFRLSARAMLRRLNERLTWETESFYASALQAGAISLRQR